MYVNTTLRPPNPPDKLKLRKGLEFSSQTSHSKFSIAEGHQKNKTAKDLRVEGAVWVGIFQEGTMDARLPVLILLSY